MHLRVLTIMTALMILPNLGMGQIKKGEKVVGISGLPVSLVNDGSIQSYGFVIKSYLGKQIKDRVSIGLQPYYANVSGTKTLGTNFYSRYNLLARRSLIFLEGSAGFGVVTYYNSSPFDEGLFSFTFGPGVSYFVSESISIDFMVQYQQWSILSENVNGRSVVPSIGAIIYLNK